MIEQFKAALQEVAKYGQNGDTVLAHITPEEEEYLEREFGGSTTNPITGLKEYAGEPGAGAGGHGEGESGIGRGGGGTGGGGGGGRAERGEVRSGTSSMSGPARGGTGFGGSRGGSRGSPGGRADPADVRSGSASKSGPARGGLGIGAQQSATAAKGSAQSRGIAGVLSGIMGLGLGVPSLGFVDEETGLRGLPGMAHALAKGLGELKDVALGETSAQFGKVESADPQGPTGVDVAAPGGVPGGHPDVEFPRSGPLDYSLTRPDEMEAPHFLGLGDAMTPLQQRSALATYGTAGEAGGYRSDPAQDYYKNLFLRNVLGEQGEVLEDARVLPVEAQYARNMGYDVTPEMGVENFARALSELPSAEQVAEYMAAWNAANPQREREQR